MKIAPIIRELRNSCSEKIVYEILHTKQHYDSSMSDVFFKDLEIPLPVYYLREIENPAKRLSHIIKGSSDILTYNPFDLVLVVGDVDSTLACALAAYKCKVPIAHIESGERSYDRSMPEEINRILVDNISTYLFCSTETALDNLALENIDCKTAFLVGNPMVDSILYAKHKLIDIIAGLPENYIVITIHRESNVLNYNVLRTILSEIDKLSEKIPVFFPMHPRTYKIISSDLAMENWSPNVKILAPMPYMDFISLVQGASLVITDSGGVQIEAGVLKTPCVTVRNTTEHTSTVEAGCNTLSEPNNIWDTTINMMKRKNIMYPEFGDGNASIRIVEKVMEIFNV